LIALAVVGLLLILLIVAVISVYNRLVRGRGAVENAWAQVDVQLKRRHDLIPNLVETVKGYAGHERQTLEAVVAARGQAVEARGPRERAAAEERLTGALRGLLAVAESYPALQAGQQFTALQEELATTENRIAYSRQYYNDAVLAYNNAIRSVPTNIIAGMTGFEPAEYFAAEGDERGPVQVRF
jgi:LemA protein